MAFLYEKAYEFAASKHAGQLRKDGITPYIEHPKLVAELVRQYKSSSNMEQVVAAALLHDTLEDTYTSYRELIDEFGEMIASMVLELTTADYMVLLMGKAQYLEVKMCDMSNYALVIKLADRLANVLDYKGLNTKQRAKLYSDTVEIISYLEKHRQLTASQVRLIDAIKDALGIMVQNTPDIKES